MVEFNIAMKTKEKGKELQSVVVSKQGNTAKADLVEISLTFLHAAANASE